MERKPPDAVVGPFESMSSAFEPERNALPAVVADGRVNILIVDDEPANLKVLEVILDDPGYRLVRATSANDALLALMADDFGLLILDIRMPDMSGFELANLIKQRKKSASVPIIFLTAFYNEDQDVLAGYGTGAVDYLHKPVNATVLRSKVAVFVELHRKSRELAMANRALLLEVTERRRAEEQLRELNESLDRRVTERSEALRESEQRFRTMADQTPVMMWVTSPSGLVEFVNKEYCVFFGVSSEEAVHSSWRMPVHDDDGGYLRALSEALRTHRPFQAVARDHDLGAARRKRWRGHPHLRHVEGGSVAPQRLVQECRSEERYHRFQPAGIDGAVDTIAPELLIAIAQRQPQDEPAAAEQIERDGILRQPDRILQ